MNICTEFSSSYFPGHPGTEGRAGGMFSLFRIHFYSYSIQEHLLLFVSAVKAFVSGEGECIFEKYQGLCFANEI